MDAKENTLVCFCLGQVCGVAGRAQDAGVLTAAEVRQLQEVSGKLWRWLLTVSIESCPRTEAHASAPPPEGRLQEP